jgi:secondary thiamine-phosphate synthase enzyme
MHRDVDAAGQQVLLDLAREQALAADLLQRAVQHGVAGGLDDDDLEGGLWQVEGRGQTVAGFVGLGQGEGRAAGADAQRPMRITVTIATNGLGLYDFTEAVTRWLADRGDGLLTVFVQHTSCSLLIQENADPDVRRDLRAFLTRLVPPADDPSMAWLTHTLEGPDDMPAHIKAALLPVSLSIPVTDGTPVLGTWQGLYLVEHRTAPHNRRVVVHFAPDVA